MYCQNCGNECREDAKFCNQCGTKLGVQHNENRNAISQINRFISRFAHVRCILLLLSTFVVIFDLLYSMIFYRFVTELYVWVSLSITVSSFILFSVYLFNSKNGTKEHQNRLLTTKLAIGCYFAVLTLNRITMRGSVSALISFFLYGTVAAYLLISRLKDKKRPAENKPAEKYKLIRTASPEFVLMFISTVSASLSILCRGHMAGWIITLATMLVFLPGIISLILYLVKVCSKKPTSSGRLFATAEMQIVLGLSYLLKVFCFTVYILYALWAFQTYVKWSYEQDFLSYCFNDMRTLGVVLFIVNIGYLIAGSILLFFGIKNKAKYDALTPRKNKRRKRIEREMTNTSYETYQEQSEAYSLSDIVPQTETVSDNTALTFDEVAQKLIKLKQLFEIGALTQEEYENERKKYINYL